jgi:hypothetical protein
MRFEQGTSGYNPEASLLEPLRSVLLMELSWYVMHSLKISSLALIVLRVRLTIDGVWFGE